LRTTFSGQGDASGQAFMLSISCKRFLVHAARAWHHLVFAAKELIVVHSWTQTKKKIGGIMKTVCRAMSVVHTFFFCHVD
jgi:hypothetical protein